MTFLDHLSALMAEHGDTVASLSRNSGIPYTTIDGFYKKGYTNAKLSTLQKLCDYYHITLDDLVSGESDLAKAASQGIVPIKRRRVRLLGDIAAGQPIFADEDYDSYVAVDEDVHCDFALRVQGDSMEPTLNNGDVVFLREQDDVDDGQIAAVIVDDSATLKHIQHIKGGLRLISENWKYEPMEYTCDNCDGLRIIGKAVAYTRMIK